MSDCESIPEPKFYDPRCNCIATCCHCSKPTFLFWVNDAVWKQLHPAIECEIKWVCVSCATLILKRNLTLNDIAIEKYLYTDKNYPNGEIANCIVDTVMGAAAKAGVREYPSEWCTMWTSYTQFGELLATNTPNAQAIIPSMIKKVRELFPHFRNPYLDPAD